MGGKGNIAIGDEKMDDSIREMREEEYPLLKDFLYEAIFVPPGTEPPPRSILERSELQVYIADFGRGICDRAWAAEADGRVIGAVWARIMEDYGHIDEHTPSLAIAVFAPWRGRGVGMALMKRMLSELKENGYARVSLSVQKANAALHLYKRFGFVVIRESGEEYIMEKRLATETHTVL